MPVVEANASLVEPEDQKQLVQIVQQNNLHADTALSLQSAFAPFFKQARDVIEKSRSIVVTDASQEMEMKMARLCRLKLRDIRVAAEKKRKELKDEYVRGGRAIDGFNAILLHISQSEETRLQQQEDFVATKEAERKAALKADREKILTAIQVDPNLYALSEMAEETFQQLVEGTKLARAADAERKRKEEAERIEREAKEQAERERIRLENERLKKEAAEQEAKARLEREMAEKELKRLADEKRAALLKAQQEREAAEKERKRVEAENVAKLLEQKRIADEAAVKERARVAEEQRIAAEAARKEREAIEAKAAAERAESERKAAALKKASDELRAKEKAARDELEAKLKAQREADELRKRQEAEAARKAAAAPDKEKIVRLAKSLDVPIPEMSTPEGKAVIEAFMVKQDALIGWLREEYKKL